MRRSSPGAYRGLTSRSSPPVSFGAVPNAAVIVSAAPKGAGPEVGPDAGSSTAELTKEIKALRAAIVTTGAIAAGDAMLGRARSPGVGTGPGTPLHAQQQPPVSGVLEEVEALRRELRHTSEAYAALSKQSRAQKVAAEQRERELSVELHRVKSHLTDLNRMRKDHAESTAAAKGYKERAEAAEKTAETLRERLEEVRKGKDTAASTIAKQAAELQALRQDLYRARDVAEAGDRAVTGYEALQARLHDAEQRLSTAAQEREALLDCVQEQQRTIEGMKGQAGDSLHLSQELAKRDRELESLRSENASLKHHAATVDARLTDLRHNTEPLAARAKQADEMESVQQELLRTISAQAAQLQEAQDAVIVARSKDGSYQNAALLDRKRLERAERLLGQYRALEEELVRRTGDPFFDALLVQRRMDSLKGPSNDNLPLLPGGILGTLGGRNRDKRKGSDTDSNGSDDDDEEKEQAVDKPLLARYLSRLDTRVRKDASKQAAADVAAAKERCSAEVAAVQAQCDDLRAQLSAATSERDAAQASLRALQAADERLGALLERALPSSSSLSSSSAVPSTTKRGRSKSRGGAGGRSSAAATGAGAGGDWQREQLSKQLLLLDWLACLDPPQNDDEDDNEGGVVGASAGATAALLPRMHSLLAALKESLSLAVRQKRVAECEAQDLREELVSLREGSSIDAANRSLIMGEANAAVRSAKAERERVLEELQEAEQKFQTAAQSLADERARVQRYKDRVIRAKAIIQESEHAAAVANAKASAAEASSHGFKLEIAALEQRWRDAKAMNDRALEMLHHRDEEVRRLETKVATLLNASSSSTADYTSGADDSSSHHHHQEHHHQLESGAAAASHGYRAVSVPRYGGARETAAVTAPRAVPPPKQPQQQQQQAPPSRVEPPAQLQPYALRKVPLAKPSATAAPALPAARARSRSRSPNGSGSISLVSRSGRGKSPAAAVRKSRADELDTQSGGDARNHHVGDNEEEEEEDYSVSLGRSFVKPVAKASATAAAPASPAPGAAARTAKPAVVASPADGSGASISLGSLGQHHAPAFATNAVAPAPAAAAVPRYQSPPQHLRKHAAAAGGSDSRTHTPSTGDKSGSSPDTVASKTPTSPSPLAAGNRPQWNDMLLQGPPAPPASAVASSMQAAAQVPAPAPAPAPQPPAAVPAASAAAAAPTEISAAKKTKNQMKKEKKAAAKRAASASPAPLPHAVPPAPAAVPTQPAAKAAPAVATDAAASSAKPPTGPATSVSKPATAAAAPQGAEAKRPFSSSSSSASSAASMVGSIISSISSTLEDLPYSSVPPAKVNHAAAAPAAVPPRPNRGSMGGNGNGNGNAAGVNYYSDDFESYHGEEDDEGRDVKQAAASGHGGGGAGYQSGAGSRRSSVVSLREKLQRHGEELGIVPPSSVPPVSSSMPAPKAPATVGAKKKGSSAPATKAPAKAAASTKAAPAATTAFSAPALLPYRPASAAAHNADGKRPDDRKEDDGSSGSASGSGSGSVRHAEISFAVSTPDRGMGATMATTRAGTTAALGATFMLSPPSPQAQAPSAASRQDDDEENLKARVQAEASSRDAYAQDLSKWLLTQQPQPLEGSPIWKSPVTPKQERLDASEMPPAGIPNPRLTSHGEALLQQHRAASGPFGQPEALFQREAVVSPPKAGSGASGAAAKPKAGGIKRGGGMTAASAAAISSKLKTSPL